MRRHILYKIIGLALLIVSIVACETATQDVSPLGSTNDYVVATFATNFTGSSVTEGDTIKYTITTDRMIDRSLTFSARVLDGSTGDEDDIEVIPGVIEPYTTETTVTVVFNQDWDVESDETMELEFGVFGIADRYLLNQSVVNPVLDLTISNYVSDVVTSTFSWDKDIIVIDIVTKEVLLDNGVIHEYQDTIEIETTTDYEIDFDIGLSDVTGFDINDVWSSDIWNGAFTGDHPEEMDISDLPDGEYVLWATLWMNWAPFDYWKIKDPTIHVPITANFTRQGTEMDVTVVQPDAQAPTLDIGGEATGPAYYDLLPYYDTFEGIIAYVIVANGKYSIKQIDGTTSDSYKKDVVRSERPLKYSKSITR
jgi:hypothetical protein